MYFNKKELEELRKQGEEEFKRLEVEKKGFKYKSQAGIEITCVHCRHDRFYDGKVLMNTRGATFLGLEWLNQAANTLVCKRCGYIHWFDKDVQKLD